MPPKSFQAAVSAETKRNSSRKKDHIQIQKSPNHSQEFILASNATEKQSSALIEIIALDWHDKLTHKKSVKEAANQKRAIALKNRKENSRLSKGVAFHKDACADQNGNRDISQPNSQFSSASKNKQPIAFQDEEVTKIVTTELPAENPFPTTELPETKQINFPNPSQTATISSATFSIPSVTDTISIQNNSIGEDYRFTSTSTAGILEERTHCEHIYPDAKRRKLNPGLTIHTISEAGTEKEDANINETVELPIVCGRSTSRLIPSDTTMYFANFDDDEMDECDYDNLGDFELECSENLDAPKEICPSGILPMQLPVETYLDTDSTRIEEVKESNMLLSSAASSGDKDNNSGAFSKPPQVKRKYKKRIKTEGFNDLNNGAERKAPGKKVSRTEENTESCDDDTVNSSTQQHTHGPWTDIYAKVKLFVCMAPRNLSNSDVMIRHANEDFFVNFGFDKSSTLPMPLKSLFGHGTSRMVLHKLHMALLTGKQAYEFINLYRADKRPLACHLVLVSITGNRIRDGAQHNHSAPPNLALQCQEKYAILTIRSASVIGNAKAYGIGFFGPGRITTVRPPLANTDPNEKQSLVIRKGNEHVHEVNGITYANCVSSFDDQDDGSSKIDGDASSIPTLEYHPHHWSGHQPQPTSHSNNVAYPHPNNDGHDELQHQVSPAQFYGNIPPAVPYPLDSQTNEKKRRYPPSNKKHSQKGWGNTPDIVRLTNGNITNHHNSSSNNNNSSTDNREHAHSLIPQNPVNNPHFPQNHHPQQHIPLLYQSQSSQQYYGHPSHSQHQASHLDNNIGNHYHTQNHVNPSFPSSFHCQQQSRDSDSDEGDGSNRRLSYHHRNHHHSTSHQHSTQLPYRSRQTSIVAQESLLQNPRTTSELDQVRESSQQMHQYERFDNQRFHHHQQQQREYIR